jgi:hypothetical protein
MKQLGKDIGFSFVAELQKQFVLNPLMDALFGQRSSTGNRAGGLIGTIGGFIANLFKADDGGIVPGPIGAPRLVMAHGGETILPTHKGMAGGMGGVTVVNHIDARGAQRGVSRDIQRAIDAGVRSGIVAAQRGTIDDRRRSNNTAKVF